MLLINNCVGEDNHCLLLQLCFYTQILSFFTLVLDFGQYYYFQPLTRVSGDTTTIEKMFHCCDEISKPRKAWQQTFAEVFGTCWKILWFVPFRKRQPQRIPYHFTSNV
ncbi:putative palmitoyltransferase ZDHHC21 [Acipenser ruthenus]|uniref:Putative palmitoyltransferase ZDHHC21 n=1 Tax=Acipenser ruthenus TaxID=7906 RepID=A0A444U5M9_ACIRT|nr:putative palmitoyltransferase ZDHHC21 [Acipenser ruthenus]